MNTKEDVVSSCTIDGNIVRLPDAKLDRKLYLEVAKAFELIGGKWKGGKTFGFVFSENPQHLLNKLINGESTNMKKDFQFFATPNEVANILVSYSNVLLHHKILEPSAGQGAIVCAINRILPSKIVDCIELMPINIEILKNNKNANIIGDNFLKYNGQKYDRIIANPPFSKNQDIQHIRKMFDCLENGGVLASICSKHWKNSTGKKEMEFKAWLSEKETKEVTIPAGAFKKSGTNIETMILLIYK
jgi:predicted RNA methylase